MKEFNETESSPDVDLPASIYVVDHIVGDKKQNGDLLELAKASIEQITAIVDSDTPSVAPVQPVESDRFSSRSFKLRSSSSASKVEQTLPMQKKVSEYYTMTKRLFYGSKSPKLSFREPELRRSSSLKHE